MKFTAINISGWEHVCLGGNGQAGSWRLREKQPGTQHQYLFFLIVVTFFRGFPISNFNRFLNMFSMIFYNVYNFKKKRKKNVQERI